MLMIAKPPGMRRLSRPALRGTDGFAAAWSMRVLLGPSRVCVICKC